MLRAVMYSLMAISNEDTSILPDPVFDTKGKSVYWVPTSIPDERALRPNFDVAWSKNNSWHAKFISKVRSNGSSLYPSCKQDVIDGLTDKDILQRGSRTTYKHLKEKFAKQGQSTETKEMDKRLKRWSTRKTKKAKERKAVRSQYPTLQDPRFDFIFDPVNQSTDYSSDITSNSDGGSLDDSGDEARKIRKLKSWPPEHRDENYNRLLDDITARVQAATKPSKTKKNSTHYIMVRAKTKTKPAKSIPCPVAGPKSLACFIDEAWLEAQPKEFQKHMEEFVFGPEDEGYESSWEDFPEWEKFDRKGKAKQH
ncbi:hypothetical protein C8F04DRAFT_1268974 [Mycena alexandri]|uniref:Uncharacterized protein n=1 Tax=Mycena alexandri TaxID=1745969 RepID=A0AAD6SD33_9AGAR|nr:hypothetical protein C8F04DRAFT_1268974 [Mycena alexandri]